MSQKISSSVRPHRHVSSMSLVELGKADSPSSPSSAIAILSLKAAGAVMTPWGSTSYPNLPCVFVMKCVNFFDSSHRGTLWKPSFASRTVFHALQSTLSACFSGGSQW